MGLTTNTTTDSTAKTQETSSSLTSIVSPPFPSSHSSGSTFTSSGCSAPVLCEHNLPGHPGKWLIRTMKTALIYAVFMMFTVESSRLDSAILQSRDAPVRSSSLMAPNDVIQSEALLGDQELAGSRYLDLYNKQPLLQLFLRHHKLVQADQKEQQKQQPSSQRKRLSQLLRKQQQQQQQQRLSRTHNTNNIEQQQQQVEGDDDDDKIDEKNNDAGIEIEDMGEEGTGRERVLLNEALLQLRNFPRSRVDGPPPAITKVYKDNDLYARQGDDGESDITGQRVTHSEKRDPLPNQTLINLLFQIRTQMGDQAPTGNNNSNKQKRQHGDQQMSGFYSNW